MRYFLWLFAFLPAILVAKTDDPNYAVFNIPDTLLENANAVIRNHEQIFEVKDAGTATFKVKAAITRLNENAQYSDLSVYYDSYSKVRALSAALYDGYGNLIRKIKKSEINDISAVSGSSIYQDDRVKHIDMSYGVYPYTIEYEYEIAYNSIMTYPEWSVQSFATSVEASEYQLILPSDIDVKAKLYQLDIVPKKDKLEDGGKAMLWQINNLAAKTYQHGTPERYKQLSRALFVPTKFRVAGHEGDMSSWKTYGEFMHKLNKGRDELSTLMAATVHELTDHLDSDKAKIDALYQYLQQNMRYVSVQLGIGGWQTFTAKYVEENKYGDCKALSNFMKAMLKEAGIEAYPVLIYNSRDLAFEADTTFSFPYFNHMILHVPAEQYWLECTSTYFPPNYLGFSNADRNVLLITPAGGKLVKTPPLTPANNQQISATTINLKSSGEAIVKNAVTYAGALQDYYRYQVKTKDASELKANFLEDHELPMSQIQALNMAVVEQQPEVKIQYELSIPRYATKGGKRLFIPFNSFNTFDHIPAKTEERLYPYNRKMAYTDLDTIVINLPNYAVIETMPKATTIESDFGTYSLTVETKDKQLIYYRKLVMYKMLIQPAQYEAWRKFCQAVAKKDKGKVIVKISQA